MNSLCWKNCRSFMHRYSQSRLASRRRTLHSAQHQFHPSPRSHRACGHPRSWLRRANFRAIVGGAGATLLLEVLIMASMSGGAANAGRGARGACFAAILCGGGAIGYAYLLTRVCKVVRARAKARARIRLGWC